VLVVPATVPDANVTRVRRSADERRILVSADPYPVPPAHPVRVIPDQLTAEQVAELRAENQALREELERVRAT
jgi:hypothetical protein